MQLFFNQKCRLASILARLLARISLTKALEAHFLPNNSIILSNFLITSTVKVTIQTVSAKDIKPLKKPVPQTILASLNLQLLLILSQNNPANNKFS
jgi:hypothetical protein